MSLKRVLNLFLLATLSLFVLSACSDDSGDNSANTRDDSTTSLSDLLANATESAEVTNSEVVTDSESTEEDVNTEEGENTEEDVNTEEGDNTEEDVNTEEGDNTEEDVNTEEGDNTEEDVNTEEGESTEEDVNTEEGESTEEETVAENLTEACYKYSIAEAFYNAAAELVEVADTAYANADVDSDSIIAAKDYYKQAYNLTKNYISAYNLARQYGTTYSVYLMWKYDDSLADVRSIVEDNFETLDLFTTVNSSLVNAYLSFLSDVVYPIELYLFVHAIKTGTEQVDQSNWTKIYTDFQKVAINSEYIASEVYAIFNKKYYESGDTSYLDTVKSYLTTAAESLANMDSNSCSVTE